MADYWKSQPRKFCQYCKCWIADNKPSIEFHERGKNHKENVAAKISEIKKKSVDKAKQEQRMCKQFAAMEEAAMKAYEEDLKRMEKEAAFGPDAETTSTTSTYKPVPLVQPPKQPLASREESKQKQKQKAPKQKSHPKPPRQQMQPTRTVVWVEGKTDDGYTYYYNTITGESRWDKPEEFHGAISHAAQPQNTGSSAGSAWTEAISPEGYTYYYNTQTGESSWEKPADYPSNKMPESDPQGENQEELSNTPEDQQETGELEEATNDQPSEETEVTQEVTQQSAVPKINFRKRKADTDPSEETSEALDETPEESGGENKQEESTTPVPEDKKEETQEEQPTGRFRPLNPYGTWERIKVQKDPFANIDWQLPKVESSEATTSTEIPPEPKHKFKTRIITSIGESSGPATFKKKKTQNGKSRSLRQRDDDE